MGEQAKIKPDYKEFGDLSTETAFRMYGLLWSKKETFQGPDHKDANAVAEGVEINDALINDVMFFEDDQRVVIPDPDDID